MKFHILLLLLLFPTTSVLPQDYNLKLVLNGKTYEQLSLYGYTADWNKPVIIDGKKEDENSWVFSIPDSAYNNILTCDIRYTDKNAKMRYSLSFKSGINNDTIFYRVFQLDKNVRELRAEYCSSEIEEGVYIRELGLGSHCVDKYLIPYQEGTEFAIQGEYLMFSSFNFEEGEKSYDDYIAECVSIIQKYPDSKYLLYAVYYNRQQYRSKESLQRVYAAFSEERRESVCGKELSKLIYLHPKNKEFSNTELPQSIYRDKQLIVQDSSKYNLLVFSASWCAPCHEQIPILKKLHFDLEDLIITYISIDEISTVKQWESFIRKEKIPWRSLQAAGIVKQIQEKYFVHAIPHSLLVYPRGENMEVIELRDENEKDKLYELVKNNNIE